MDNRISIRRGDSFDLPVVLDDDALASVRVDRLAVRHRVPEARPAPRGRSSAEPWAAITGMLRAPVWRGRRTRLCFLY